MDPDRRFELLRWHAILALAGEAPPPALVAPSEFGGDQLHIWSSIEFLERIKDEPERVRKPCDVIFKYGFRGYSRGGKNGIFLLRESDAGLLRLVENPKPGWLQDAFDLLGILPDGWNSLRGLKVVWHQPSGERLVGVLKPGTSDVMLLDFAFY